MIGLLCFVLAVLASPFKSKLRLEAENALLRHQLIVLKRRLHGRVRLTNHDRWFYIQLYRWFPSRRTSLIRRIDNLWVGIGLPHWLNEKPVARLSCRPKRPALPTKAELTGTAAADCSHAKFLFRAFIVRNCWLIDLPQHTPCTRRRRLSAR